MKPAPFEYYAPNTVDETLARLGEFGYEAKVLAGGQSLIPMMNFRLAQPSIIVDINKIAQLSYIRPNEQSGVSIGALARHSQVEHHPLVAEFTPLIYETMPHIATVQVRNRGTFGGSLAHADPSAELAAVSVALEGSFLLRNLQGERWVPAEEFFIGLFTSVLEPDELLIEAKVDFFITTRGKAFERYVRRYFRPNYNLLWISEHLLDDPPRTAKAIEDAILYDPWLNSRWGANSVRITGQYITWLPKRKKGWLSKKKK